MKNIKLNKTGVRVGSRKWFAAKEWTIARTNWNDHYPDVVVLESKDGDNIVMTIKNGKSYFSLEMDLTTAPVIGHALKLDLHKFVSSIIDEITTDDKVELLMSQNKP